MRGDPSVSHYLQSNESRCIRRSSLPASNERLANISLLANHGFCGTLVTVRSPVGLAVYVSRNAAAAIIGLIHGHMTFEPQIVARRLGGSSGIVGSEYFASHPARMCRMVFRGPTGWSRVFLRVGSRGCESTGHRLATIFGDRCHWVAPQSVFRCPVDLGKAIHTCFLSIVASSASRAAVCVIAIVAAGVQQHGVGVWAASETDRGRVGGLLDCGMARRKVSGSAEMRREEDETRQDFSPSSRTKTEGNTAPDWTFARKNVREDVVQPRRGPFAVP